MQIQGAMLNIANRRFVDNNDEEQANRRNTIFAANTELAQESPIEKKRREAQEKAMKVLGDAFSREQEIDKGLQESKDMIAAKRDEISEAKEQIQKLEETKESLKGTCTEEEYEQICAEYKSQEDIFRQKIEEAENAIRGENASIRNVREGRIKSTNIRDAQEEADNILEAAGKEILSEAMEQVKDHIEEKMDEQKEAAKEKEEKEEEEEKLKEAVKERNEKHEPVNAIKVATETILTYDQLDTDIQKELQNIMDEYNLTAEDIKGAAVDKLM